MKSTTNKLISSSSSSLHMQKQLGTSIATRSSFTIMLFLSFILLLMLLPSPANSEPHYHGPLEIDVSSKSCDYNSRQGLAGDIGTDYYTVDYYYKLEVNASMIQQDANEEGIISYNEPVDFKNMPSDSLQSVILGVELEIGSYMLKDSYAFMNAPCHEPMRKRKLFDLSSPKANNIMASSTSSSSSSPSLSSFSMSDITALNNDRNLYNNVGLTIGPDDQIIATCETQSDIACYYVEGYFQVYTVGIMDDNTTRTAKEDIKIELKDAMNQQLLNQAHPAIIQLTYLDTLPTLDETASEVTSNKETGDNNNDTLTSTSSSGPDAAVIIGASVGAVVLIVGVAFIRQRRRHHHHTVVYEEQSDLQDNGSIDVNEFQSNKEASNDDTEINYDNTDMEDPVPSTSASESEEQ